MIARRLLPLTRTRVARAVTFRTRRPITTSPVVAVGGDGGGPSTGGGGEFRRPATTELAHRPDAGVPDNPRDWEPVKDDATGEVYYWNRKTDETTALGDPRPGSEADLALRRAHETEQQMQSYGPPQTLGASMKQYFFLGIGISMAFMLVGKVFSEPLAAMDAVDLAARAGGVGGEAMSDPAALQDEATRR